MKIVFFGTPDYVLPVIKALHKAFVTGPGKSPIVAVVTQSPKPIGRKQIVSYSAIDRWGYEHKLPIFYNPNDLINNKIEADLGVLASYGAIISDEVLKLFPNGILNIHPSLLPEFRGSSPIQAAIATGETVTGATIIKLDEKLDHGKIVSQFKEDVLKTDTAQILRDRIFERASKVLVELIDPYIKGKIKLKPQDDSNATMTRMLKKDFGFIEPKFISQALEGRESKENWDLKFIKDVSIKPTPSSVEAYIRSMNSWPMAWTYVNVPELKRLKLLKAHVEEGKLVLDEVQLEGKNLVTWKQFLEAYPQLKF